jgi:hypothetical protein
VSLCVGLWVRLTELVGNSHLEFAVASEVMLLTAPKWTAQLFDDLETAVNECMDVRKQSTKAARNSGRIETQSGKVEIEQRRCAFLGSQ